MAERELFGAVILQAVRDVTKPPPEKGKCPKGKDQREHNLQFRKKYGEWLAERDAAKRWFERPSADFDLVCSSAGFDPDFIRRAYKEGRLEGDRAASYRVHNPPVARLGKSQESALAVLDGNFRPTTEIREMAGMRVSTESIKGLVRRGLAEMRTSLIETATGKTLVYEWRLK